MNKNVYLIQLLQENPNFFYLAFDSQMNILENNQNIRGKLTDFVYGEDVFKFNQRILKLDKSEILFFLKNAENKFIPLKTTLYKHNNNHIIIGLKISITEYSHYSSVSSKSIVTFAILNKEGLILESNDENYIVDQYILECVKAPDETKFNHAFQYAIKNNTITGFESNISDDFEHSIIYRIVPESDSDNFHLSITKLSFSNEDLNNHNYFLDLIDSSADFIYKTDYLGNIVFINETSKKRYGFEKQGRKKANFKNWVKDEYKDLVEKFYQNQFANKIESTYLEFPTITDDGDEVWVGQNVRLVLSDGWIMGIQTTARDITENKIIENELIEIQSKNQAILDSIPDSMYLFDKNFDLIDKKVEEDTYFFDLNIGQNIKETTVDHAAMSKIKKSIEACFSENKYQRIELKSLFYGVENTYDFRISIVNNKNILILIRNITESILQQKRLISSQDKEKKALETKQRYLSFMTHEIRTPLNAIIGLTDLIFDTNPTPKQMEYLKSIKSSSSILSKIINDVLDFNKLENGKITLDEITFNVHHTFKDIIRTCQVYSYSKPLSLNYEIDPNIPNLLKGDVFKLTQVMTNLISNAIKFTHKGNVKASATLVKDLASDCMLIEFGVKDTGIGIPHDKINKVFDSYEQLDSSISRKFGGTGLGLTISQKFVKILGGEIQIVSKVNEGSYFYFQIPIEISKEELKIEKKVAKIDFSSYHILLVEDNEMNQLVMGKYFNKWGLSYDIAENGKEAIEKIEENEYHLILLDLEMPIMDGFQTAEHIRNHPNQDINRMVIIALSASVFAEIEERTKVIGFNDFIGKPINANYVHNKLVEYLIKEDQKIEDESQDVEALGLHDNTEFNLSYLIESSLNDMKYVKKMVELFIQKTPEYLNEMESLLASNDLKELRKLAHKYKASVAIMGIQKAEAAIHHIETNITSNIKLNELPLLVQTVKESSLKACEELKSFAKAKQLF